MKNLMSVLMAVFLVSCLAVGMASALPAVEYVKLDGDRFEAGDQLEVERGEELDIRVKMSADVDEEDIEVRAEILGYEYSDKEGDLYDRAHTFDLDAGDTTYKDLSIQLPYKMDKDYYDLRVTVGTRKGPAFEALYPLHLKGVKHELRIRDVIFNPENSVEAGRALLTTVRIDNIGEKDEDSVKVKVSIPKLGLSASEYVDEIEGEDDEESVTSEELYMRIPVCTEPKEYLVKVSLEYDEGYEVVSTEETILVTGDICAEEDDVEKKTVITVGPESQEVKRGATVTYPVIIENAGNTARTYVVSVDGASTWANVEVTPSNLVVLNKGESKQVFVSVTAKEDATAGEHMFVLSVSSGDKTLKQLSLKGNVKEEAETGMIGLKRGLEIGVIILVILLVILGLIIGFSKLRESEDEDVEEPEKGETYY
jgi:uncharacterized membrane protein